MKFSDGLVALNIVYLIAMLTLVSAICQIRLSAQVNIILDNVYVGNTQTDRSAAILIQHQATVAICPVPVGRCANES